MFTRLKKKRLLSVTKYIARGIMLSDFNKSMPFLQKEKNKDYPKTSFQLYSEFLTNDLFLRIKWCFNLLFFTHTESQQWRFNCIFTCNCPLEEFITTSVIIRIFLCIFVPKSAWPESFVYFNNISTSDTNWKNGQFLQIIHIAVETLLYWKKALTYFKINWNNVLQNWKKLFGYISNPYSISSSKYWIQVKQDKFDYCLARKKKITRNARDLKTKTKYIYVTFSIKGSVSKI